MNLLDEATEREIDDGSSLASFVLLVVVTLFVVGALFIAMYGFPTFHNNASAQPAARAVSVVATASIDELPALVPPHTSGFSAR